MPILSKFRDIFKGSSSVKRKKIYHNVILQNPEEIWSIKGEIGDGAYGKVYKAEHLVNGTLAALKKVQLEEEDDLENFMVEIDILAECQHSNIVRLLEAYHWEGCLWMYLEFCDGGAVDSIMVDLDRPLTEPQIAYLSFHLLQALDYIHNHKVIHRDIKAGNVLLTTDGGVKLADFGVSAKNKNTMDKRGTFIGTPYWLAPEVIKCETFIDSKYDYKADIWSLGITLIEFAQVEPPNHDVSPLRVLLKIQKAEPPKLDHPSKFSKEFNDFIARCLVKEPEDRPDARTLLRHPFVSGQQSAKHIIALLIEYQADVVEEDVEEDHRSSRLSIDSEDHSTASHDTTATSDTSRGHKEVTPTGVMDRRVSKGPAPPPPVQQKKGPAPSVPPVATPNLASSTQPAAGVVTSPTTPFSSTTTTAPHTSSVTDVKSAVAASSLPPSTTTSTASSTPPPAVAAPAFKTVPPAAAPNSVTKTSSPLPSGKPTPLDAASSVSIIPPVVPDTPRVPSTDSKSVSASPPPSPCSPVTSTPIKDPCNNSSSDQVPGGDQSITNSNQSDAVPSSSSADVSIITDPAVQQVTAVSSTPPLTDVSVTTAAITTSMITPLPPGTVSGDISDSATVVSSVIPVVPDTASDVSPSTISPCPTTTTTIPLATVSFPSVTVALTEPAASPMVSVTTLGDDSAFEMTLSNSPDKNNSAALVLGEKLEVREEGDDEALPSQQPVARDATTKTQIVSDDSLLVGIEGQQTPPISLPETATPSTTVVSIADNSISGVSAGDVSTNSGVIAKISSNSPDLTIGSQQPPESQGSPLPVEPQSLPSPIPCHPTEDFPPLATTPLSRKGAESRQRLPPDSPPPPGDLPSLDPHSIIAGDAVTPPPMGTPSTAPPLPFQASEGGVADLPAQIIASIGSEGTVIVRTPTPTPSTPTPPSDNPTSPAAVPPPLLSQPSLVTFSGPGVVESAPNTPKDSPRDASSLHQDEADSYFAPSINTMPDSIDLAEVEAVQLLDDVIDHHTGGHDSLLSTDSLPPSTIAKTAASPAPAGGQVLVLGAPEPDVVVVSPQTEDGEGVEVVISSSSILEGESNTDDASSERVSSPTSRGAPSTRDSEAAHISVVSVAESEAGDGDTRVTIEGTTTGDTDVDSLIPVPAKEEVPSGRSPPSRLPNGREAAVPGTPGPRHEDRSDSDSISTISSEKENSKPRRRGGSISGDDDSGAVILRRGAGRTISGDSTKSHLTTASTSLISTAGDGTPPLPEDVSLRPIDKNRQNRQANNLMRNGRTKEENDSLALRKKTRKRTRKFMIDGVVVTTTTSKVIYGDDEEGNIMASGHLARKQELRELKILQKLEQKQFQELGIKASQARHEQERKFESEKTQLIRSYDNDVDLLNRSQKQEVERTEAQHEVELKGASKKIRADQEKELRSFRESLKTELKLLKQEVDLLPKDVRKETLRNRKEHLESDQGHREKVFLERLHQNHESSMKRLSEEHRSHVALLERQFLQKKHQLLRAREAALWELEERHLHDRHQLAKRQLKDIFFLQRHQMLLRHEKELEQVRRQNTHREEELIKRQAVERRAMPKRIKQEMKAREAMFRESMRISTTNLPDFHHDEKERLRKFQECEKRRYEAEKKRADQKHKRQMEELQAATEAHAKELEQLQNEKRKMLMEHETHKLKAQEEEYQKELREWKNNLKPRKQKLEEEFEQQLMEQEQFYGAYLNHSSTTLMAATGSTAQLHNVE